MNKWVSVAVVVALGFGCSSKTDKPNYIIDNGGFPATGGKRSTGGKSGTATGGTAGSGQAGGAAGSSSTAAGESGAGGAVQATPPSVTITSPTQVDTPDTGPVLVDTSVTVSCTVTQGSSAISTVGISMTGADNKPIDAKNVANSPSNQNQYTASFAIQSISGPVKFACTATDRSTPAQSATQVVSTFVDHGPSVIIKSPSDKSAVSGNGNLTVSFTASPVALTTSGTDNGQVIDSVSLQVGGVDVKPAQDASDPTLYTGTINLADKGLFQSLPAQISVTASALNKRAQPGPVKGSASNIVYPDSTGPSILPKQPLEGTVVGGITTVKFTLDDLVNGSGVKPDTIQFTYGKTTTAFSTSDNNWSHPGEEYWYTFDANTMDQDKDTVQKTLQITVSDAVGNTTIFPWHVYLDDQPPFLSLDPAACRVTRTTNCSAPFDSVGVRATSNLDTTAPTAYVRVRALVMEMAKWDGGDALFFAHVDQSTVWVYASDPSVPLLVRQSASSNSCMLNPKADTLAKKHKMTGVTVGSNNPDFTQNNIKFSDGVPPLPDPTQCVSGSPASTPLCSGTSDLFYVLPQYYDKTESAIYATEVVNDTNSAQCAGYQWDLYNEGLPEGWVCLAAEGADKVGNVGISAPIAVCFNKSGTADCSAATRPTCTDGCTPPSRSPGGLDSKGNRLIPFIWYGGDDASGNPLPFVITYSPM